MNKEIVYDINELDACLQKIDNTFAIKTIIHESVPREKVVSYYRNSFRVYKYIHSYRGSAHLALNYDGVFSRKGFLTQLNEISERINISGAGNVLELGCGKGFNSVYLAKKHPGVKFCGIDISRDHLKIARRKAKDMGNLVISYGDFHTLDFEDASYDFIFDLEAISHAKDHEQVLSEIYRVLKTGGCFVLYDGFRQSGFHALPDNLMTAAVLTEKSMAVKEFARIDAWLEQAKQFGFDISCQEDLSGAVKPNLARLQLLSRKYFEFPMVSKICVKLFGHTAMMNCIAVLLMPFTMYNNAHGYYKIILGK